MLFVVLSQRQAPQGATVFLRMLESSAEWKCGTLYLGIWYRRCTQCNEHLRSVMQINYLLFNLLQSKCCYLGLPSFSRLVDLLVICIYCVNAKCYIFKKLRISSGAFAGLLVEKISFTDLSIKSTYQALFIF